MVKCILCRKTIEQTFLGKIKGTYVKKRPVCNECQRKYQRDLIDKVKP